MGKTNMTKTPDKVTLGEEVTIVPSTDVTKTKETKLSLKSVTSLLGNLDGFTSEEQKNIQDVMKTLQDKGKVTSGQGGGSSTDTKEMIDFRKNFDISCNEQSDGYDITKTGLKKYYKLDTDGRKSYMMLYFRRSGDKTTPTK
jgi:soluble cytochrome b562